MIQCLEMTDTGGGPNDLIWALGGMTYETAPFESFYFPTVADKAVLKTDGKGSIGKYVGDASIYRCPSDKSYIILANQKSDRARSYAANDYLGTHGPNQLGPLGSGGMFNKFSAVIGISPSDQWSILEAHEDSIEDSVFVNVPRNTSTFNGWVEIPAARHSAGACMSFADGRVERHKWLETSTRIPVKRVVIRFGMPLSGPSKDVRWLTEHATALP